MNNSPFERDPATQPPVEPQRGLTAPPPFLLWGALVILFLIVVGALAVFSFISSGQRLASLLPFGLIAFVGVLTAVVLGSFIYRRRLPQLMWLWLSILSFMALVAFSLGSVVVYRTVLPPRYQEQFREQFPVLEVFLPPTPPGGVIPTVAATSSISIDELLALPIPGVTEEPEAIITPEATPEVDAQAQIVLAPTATPLATATFAPTPTDIPPTATLIPPTATVVEQAAVDTVNTTLAQERTRPMSERMYGFTHVQQSWNNCGPANVTMALSHFGWRETQEYAASYIKPNPEDKNVSPHEIVNFINSQTGVRAITRIGGDLDLLKDLIVANIPIIVERGYTPEGEDWLGHYQTVVGYDDNARVFYVYDSYLGTGVAGAGLPESYDEFDQGWQAFNRVFIAVYEQDRESIVQQILADHADPQRAAEIALATARAEAIAQPNNGFAWFNMGSAYARLEMWEEAAASYDRATQHSLPFRMLWYQFGPFEAYYNAGRYDDVLALVNNNLINAGSYVEETFYWQGRVLAARGDSAGAASSFRRALAQNPLYVEAQQALDRL